MSRWKYKSAAVTVDDNTQNVRMLTAGERKQFAEASQKIAKGEMQANELPAMVVAFGAIDPKLTAEEIADMPPDLIDACVSKIMELTGMKRDEPDDADGEKKVPGQTS